MAELIIFIFSIFQSKAFPIWALSPQTCPDTFSFFLKNTAGDTNWIFHSIRRIFHLPHQHLLGKEKILPLHFYLFCLHCYYLICILYTHCPPIFLKWCLLIAKNANRFRYLSKWRILKKTKNYKKLLNSISFPILLYLQAAEIILWSFFTVKKYHWIHDSSLIFKKYSQILLNRSVGVRPNVTVEYFSWISEIHINNSNSVVFLG